METPIEQMTDAELQERSNALYAAYVEAKKVADALGEQWLPFTRELDMRKACAEMKARMEQHLKKEDA